MKQQIKVAWDYKIKNQKKNSLQNLKLEIKLVFGGLRYKIKNRHIIKFKSIYPKNMAFQMKELSKHPV